jgi:hypothetical protein
MNDNGAPPADTALLTRKRLPNRRGHMLLDFEADGFRYTAGLGFFEDGRLAEVFLNSGKIGTAIETAARDSAVVASIALQHGVPPDTIRHALTRDRNGNASGPLGTLLDLLAAEPTP